MPYSSTSQLNPSVKKHVPRGKWKMWMRVFNSCYAKHGDDAVCFKQAHAAVNRSE